jgi:hypothetical protein
LFALGRADSESAKQDMQIDFHVERENDVVPDQFEMRVTDQVFDVPSRSGEKIIDAEDDRPVREQTLTQVRTEETSTASNQYPRF